MKIADIMEKLKGRKKRAICKNEEGELPDFILLSRGFGGIFQFARCHALLPAHNRGKFRCNNSSASPELQKARNH